MKTHHKLMMKVMSGGAFTPRDILNLGAWWDFSDLSTLDVSGDGEAIGAVTDKSGAGRALAQATAGNKPLLKLSIQNGRSVSRYDNVDDFLSLTSFNVGKANTILIVYIPVVALSDILLATDSVNNYVFVTNVSIFYNANTAAVDVAHGGLTNATPYILGIVRNGTSVDFYKNGAQIGTTQTLPANNDITFTNLGAASDGSFPTNGDIGEVIIYTDDVTAAQLQQLEDYLSAKWGIPLA